MQKLQSCNHVILIYNYLRIYKIFWPGDVKKINWCFPKRNHPHGTKTFFQPVLPRKKNWNGNICTKFSFSRASTELPHTVCYKKIYLCRLSNQYIENLEKLKKLQLLNLSCNMIEKMERLEKLTKLRELNLSYNAISRIEGIETLTALQVGQLPLFIAQGLYVLKNL